MSLERLVREFAERVRAELIARIESEKDQDTAIVKWQGFDENGNPIVKDTDQIRTAKGLGNISQKIGSKLIYDKAGSVEYKQKRITKFDVIKKKKLPEALRARRISRTPLLADLFESLDMPMIAFYVITYGTVQPGMTRLINPQKIEAGGYSGGTQQPDTATSTFSVPDCTATATGGTTYRIAVGAAAFRSETHTGGTGAAAGSVSGLGLDLSISGSGNDGDTAIAINVEQTNGGGTVTLSAEGAWHSTGSPHYLSINLGEGAAAFNYAYVSLQRAVYYFQMPNDAITDEVRIRQIDLNAITPNKVYESRIVHNYVSREAGDVFAYTIYYVLDVDMNQQYDTSSTDTQYTKGKDTLIGKVTKYIVHTKLNMSTGEYEHKINASPNTGNYDSITGGLRVYDKHGPAEGQDGTWLMRVIANAESKGPLYTSGHQNVGTNVGNVGYQYFAQRPWLRYSFNPEAIWRESYEGDWLHVHKDIVWDATAAVNVSDNQIYNFLNLSYKNSFFWKQIDSELSGRWFNRTEIAGTGWEGNTPLTGTYLDIIYMYSFTSTNSTYYWWSDYFNGSVPNVPDDWSSWRTWNLATQNYTYVSAGILNIQVPAVSEISDTLPDFSLAENVLEAGVPIGDRLCYPKTWFSFVPLDSIRIISYEITTETIDGIPQQIVTFITSLEGYTFYVGDVIQISEDTAINGQYSIYQVNSNTEFKVSLPGSTNTAGPVTSTGIATKLPPAT